MYNMNRDRTTRRLVHSLLVTFAYARGRTDVVRTHDFRKERARPEGGPHPFLLDPLTQQKRASHATKGPITPPKDPIIPL